MKFPGFCSGTYQSESLNIDAQRCMNLYVERNAPESASPMALYSTPGKVQFCDLVTGPVGGLFKYQPAGSPAERVFAVATQFTEIFANGTFKNYSFVTTALPVTMAANNANQIITCTGGNLWLFSTTTNTAVQVAQNLGVQFASVAFLNGFFLALQLNSQTVWFSNVEDGTTWQGLNFFAVNLFPDNVLSMIVDHGLIWLHGSKQTAVYYNTTDPLNPFLPATTQPIEQGTGAPFAEVRLDNSIFWLGADERGAGIAWRASGYTPIRVSTYAVETAWRQYSTIADAIGYSYQENGHPFWVIYFPTANTTWIYDPSVNLWHERSFWTGSKEVADRGRCHVFAFGKHLLGDTQSGKIWDSSVNYLTDFGNPIRRYRRAPHINAERQRIFHKSMEVQIESGQGPSILVSSGPQGVSSFTLQDSSLNYWTVTMNGSFILQSAPTTAAPLSSVFIQDGAIPNQNWQLGINTFGQLTLTSTATVGLPSVLMITIANTQGAIGASGGNLQSFPGVSTPVYRGPYVYLRWSDDGGHTWKSPQLRDAGQLGQYNQRVIWHRLGRSRDRVYEFGTSEAFSLRVVDAYLWAEKAQQGPQYA